MNLRDRLSIPKVPLGEADRWDDRHLNAPHSGVRISVIIPVSNAQRYLPELLASLDDQGLDDHVLQLIIVDDGSTEGSGTTLDQFARHHPGAVVLHQENSGWPGQPRNRALELATGRWIFLPMSKRQAFRTFTPHKLIRRHLIEDAGIRFREGKVRLEDGIFLSRCYLLADRLAILADRDLYYFRGRDDGGNISAQQVEPESYVGSLEEIAQNVYELSRGPKMTRALIAELLRRKVFNLYTPQRLGRCDPERQRRWLDAHASFITAHVTSSVRSALSPINAHWCDVVLTGDRAALLRELADCTSAPVAPELTGSVAPVSG